MNKWFIPYISNHSVLWKICLVVLLSTFFILFFLQPFGDIRHGFTLLGLLRIVSYSVTASGIVFVSELFLSRYYRSHLSVSQTRYGALLWYFLLMLLVAVGIYCCRSFWMGWANASWLDLLSVMYRVFVIAILPFCLTALLLLLNQKKLMVSDLVLTSSDTNPEQLRISYDELLYLSSEENYTGIHLLVNGKQEKKLLRGSLSHFERQVQSPIIRIHRSYMINLQRVSAVKINSTTGNLNVLTVDSSFTISRKYLTHFQNHWARLH